MQSDRNITLSYTGGASYCDLTVNIFIFCLKLVHFDDLVYGDTVFWLLLTVTSILKYCLKYAWSFRDGSRISGKGSQMYMYKVVGVCFADFISFFLNLLWKWNNLVSRRQNYFIFIGYLKTGVGEAGVQANPLNPILIRHWAFLSC